MMVSTPNSNIEILTSEERDSQNSNPTEVSEAPKATQLTSLSDCESRRLLADDDELAAPFLTAICLAVGLANSCCS